MMYTRSRPKGPTRDGLVIVLGGGIAGLAAAAALADAGRKVIVLEGGDRLGGMHRSVDIGPYTFDVGSIFYEETARLLYLAEGLRELCPPADRVQRRLTPDGQVMHYPFDPGDILKWPRRQQFRAVASLLLARLISRRDGTLEGVCVSQLGRVLFEETGLRNYTTQFNGVTPDQIDEEFYFDRMKFVHAAARPGKAIRSALRAIMGKPYRSKPKVPLRIRPRDGYGPMFELVAADLRARGVEILTGAALRSISGDPGALSVTTEAGTHGRAHSHRSPSARHVAPGLVPNAQWARIARSPDAVRVCWAAGPKRRQRVLQLCRGGGMETDDRIFTSLSRTRDGPRIFLGRGDHIVGGRRRC